MIQRIQTIYLLLVSVLTGLMLFFPLAEFIQESGHLYLFNVNNIQHATGEKNEIIANTFPVLALICCIAFIAFCSIFLYKKRMLQMGFCVINVLLMIGLYGVMLYYVMTMNEQLKTHVHYSFTVVFPMISIILCILAYIRIKKDEMLVRSLNRIR